MAKENNFLTEHLPLADFPISVYFVLELKEIDVCFKKKKMKFYKETLKKALIILYRTKYKSSSQLVVVKPSTSSHIEFHEIKLNLMKYALNCVS